MTSFIKKIETIKGTKKFQLVLIQREQLKVLKGGNAGQSHNSGENMVGW